MEAQGQATTPRTTSNKQNKQGARRAIWKQQLGGGGGGGGGGGPGCLYIGLIARLHQTCIRLESESRGS